MQVKETCHKIFCYPEFTFLLQSEIKQLSQLWPILLLLSVSFMSNWAKQTALPYDVIALGRGTLGEMQLSSDSGGRGGLANRLPFPGLTVCHFTSTLFGWLPETCPLFPPWTNLGRGPWATKALTLHRALATSWEGENALTVRISYTSSEWKEISVRAVVNNILFAPEKLRASC